MAVKVLACVLGRDIMLTLREFLEEINAYEQYRIYQPNRDCLIFESYYKVHSPYTFGEDGSIGFNNKYWDNNDYCDDVRKRKEFDDETKTFLARFGDYKVSSLECSETLPRTMYRDVNGDLHIEEVTDELNPNKEYINCFNIFIIPQ